MRRYYLHTRHNGVFYAELVDPHTGTKLTARSTGTRSRDEALLIIAEWLKSGVPTGKVQKPRTLEAAAGIENILKVIRRTELSSNDALRIVQALKSRDLIDIAPVKSGKGSVLFTEFLENFCFFPVALCRIFLSAQHNVTTPIHCTVGPLLHSWGILEKVREFCLGLQLTFLVTSSLFFHACKSTLWPRQVPPDCWQHNSKHRP